MNTVSTRNYRVALSSRRICWFFVVSLPATLFISNGIRLAYGAEISPPSELVFFCVLLFFSVIALIVASCLKLRIDARGVHRHFFRDWDHWSWSDLKSGRIEKIGLVFHDPERAWWNRSLNFGHLAESEVADFLATINERYKLPPPPPIAGTVTVKLNAFQTIRFSAEGVESREFWQSKRISWHEIRDIHITRHDPVRHDFHELVMQLPDRELRLADWVGGATSKEVDAILFKHAAEKIHVSIIGEPLQKVLHIERELKKQQHTRQKIIGVALASLVLVFTLPVLSIFEEGYGPTAVWRSCVLMGSIFAFFSPIFAVSYFPTSAKCKQLKQQLKIQTANSHQSDVE